MVEDKGWAFATNGKKAHYFIGGKSLCGKHEFYGYVSDVHHNSASNCRVCRTKQMGSTK